MKALRWTRGLLHSFFNLGFRWSGLSTPRPGHLNAGRDKFGGAAGPVSEGAESFENEKK